MCGDNHTESVVLAKETKVAKVKLREVEERGREICSFADDDDEM